MYRFACTALLISALVIAGCQPVTNDPPQDSSVQRATPPMTGSARVVTALPKDDAARIRPSDVTSAKVQVTWNGGQTALVSMFETDPDVFEVVLENLPTTIPCTVVVTGHNAAGTPIYSGTVTGVVFPEGNLLDVLVNLVAADNNVSAGAGPRILSVLRPSADIPAGMMVDLQFFVRDLDDTQLQYTLSSSGNGTFDHATGTIPLTGGDGQLDVVFTTPTTPGTADVRLVVADAAGLSAEFSFSLTLVRPPAGQFGGAGWIKANFPPTIQRIELSQLPDDNVFELLAVVEDDGPLTGLTYLWSAYGQAYGSENPLTLVYNVSALPMTLKVTDSTGASTTLSFLVSTLPTSLGELPLHNVAPRIAGAFLSRQDVSYGDQVGLGIYATDANGDQLHAAWQADGGLLWGATTNVEGQFHVFRANWQPAIDAGDYTVTVAISDPDGATVTYMFVVHEILGRVGLTAVAGDDQETFINGAITLNGSASHSDDGAITSYVWKKLSGPPATIDTPNAPVTTAQLSAEGTYVFNLEVKNVNNVADDVVSISVVNPLIFSFDEADMASNGLIYLLDIVNARLRRYDAGRGVFLPSFPLGIAVDSMAVAPDGSEVFLGYQGGAIEKLNPQTGERSPFASTAGTPFTMGVTGHYLFTIHYGGSYMHSLFSRATGARTHERSSSYKATGMAYAPSLSRVFYLRDNVSPNDIYRQDIDQAAGTLGAESDSPYHGDYSFSYPIRVFPDQTKVAVASGAVFSTTNLNIAATFPYGYKDLAFWGNNYYLVRAVNNQSELTIFNSAFQVQEVRFYPSPPLRLFAYNDALILISDPNDPSIKIDTIPLP